jgi:hypothetical protein
MSFAIVLGSWTAASIILSPLIGRFLAGPGGGASDASISSQNIDGPKLPSLAKPRHAGTGNMRRNVATQLHRREAGWPRAI